MFEKHNYSGARERLETLKEDVPDPIIRQQLEFVYLLSCAYEAWDALEFGRAHEYLTDLNRQLARDRAMHGDFLLMDFAPNLAKQEAILAPLHEIETLIKDKRNNSLVMSQGRYMTPLMFTMLQNAAIREEQGKLDMATLLLYRLLEMIEQCRLSHYNLYVSKMDYFNIKPDEHKHPEWCEMDAKSLFNTVKARYLEIKDALFPHGNNSSYMPDQISLLDGFTLLLALDDDISKQGNGRDIDQLKRIRSMVYLRNNSIFAHGLGPVSAGDFTKFKGFVLEMFLEYCSLEQIDFRAWSTDIAWIDPLQSVNYNTLGER